MCVCVSVRVCLHLHVRASICLFFMYGLVCLFILLFCLHVILPVHVCLNICVCVCVHLCIHMILCVCVCRSEVDRLQRELVAVSDALQQAVGMRLKAQRERQDVLDQVRFPFQCTLTTTHTTTHT